MFRLSDRLLAPEGGLFSDDFRRRAAAARASISALEDSLLEDTLPVTEVEDTTGSDVEDDSSILVDAMTGSYDTIATGETHLSPDFAWSKSLLIFNLTNKYNELDTLYPPSITSPIDGMSISFYRTACNFAMSSYKSIGRVFEEYLFNITVNKYIPYKITHLSDLKSPSYKDHVKFNLDRGELHMSYSAGVSFFSALTAGQTSSALGRIWKVVSFYSWIASGYVTVVKTLQDVILPSTNSRGEERGGSFSNSTGLNYVDFGLRLSTPSSDHFKALVLKNHIIEISKAIDQQLVTNSYTNPFMTLSTINAVKEGASFKDILWLTDPTFYLSIGTIDEFYQASAWKIMKDAKIKNLLSKQASMNGRLKIAFFSGLNDTVPCPLYIPVRMFCKPGMFLHDKSIRGRRNTHGNFISNSFEQLAQNQILVYENLIQFGCRGIIDVFNNGILYFNTGFILEYPLSKVSLGYEVSLDTEAEKEDAVNYEHNRVKITKQHPLQVKYENGPTRSFDLNVVGILEKPRIVGQMHFEFGPDVFVRILNLFGVKSTFLSVLN